VVTEEAKKSRSLLPRKHTETHGRKDEDKIVMATESTEEHGKIKSTELTNQSSSHSGNVGIV